MNVSDKRCCGSGVCIINDVGECWCGQVWDGEKMVAPHLDMPKSDGKIQENHSEESK